MSNLTKIASLPMGPGCLSSLPPEVGKEPTVVMKSDYFCDEEEQSWLFYALDLPRDVE